MKKNTRPRRANAGKGIERHKMKFGGNKYGTQFTNITGEKKKYFIHDMHKLDVDVTFNQMTATKVIKKHGERAVSAMYKEYKQL